jgi:hypothetical protein
VTAPRRRALTRIVKSVIRTAIAAWMLMLLLGGGHHDFTPGIPALGYGTCVVYTIGAMVLVSAFATQAASDTRADLESED